MAMPGSTQARPPVAVDPARSGIACRAASRRTTACGRPSGSGSASRWTRRASRTRSRSARRARSTLPGTPPAASSRSAPRSGWKAGHVLHDHDRRHGPRSDRAPPRQSGPGGVHDPRPDRRPDLAVTDRLGAGPGRDLHGVRPDLPDGAGRRRQAAKAAFRIEPTVDGTFSSASTTASGGTAVTFTPLEALAADTAYTPRCPAPCRRRRGRPPRRRRRSRSARRRPGRRPVPPARRHEGVSRSHDAVGPLHRPDGPSLDGGGVHRPGRHDPDQGHDLLGRGRHGPRLPARRPSLGYGAKVVMQVAGSALDRLGHPARPDPDARSRRRQAASPAAVAKTASSRKKPTRRIERRHGPHRDRRRERRRRRLARRRDVLPAPDELHPRRRLGHVRWRLQQPRRERHPAAHPQHRDQRPGLAPVRPATWRRAGICRPLRARARPATGSTRPAIPATTARTSAAGGASNPYASVLGHAPLLPVREAVRRLLPLREHHVDQDEVRRDRRLGLWEQGPVGGGLLGGLTAAAPAAAASGPSR